MLLVAEESRGEDRKPINHILIPKWLNKAQVGTGPLFGHCDLMFERIPTIIIMLYLHTMGLVPDMLSWTACSLRIPPEGPSITFPQSMIVP